MISRNLVMNVSESVKSLSQQAQQEILQLYVLIISPEISAWCLLCSTTVGRTWTNGFMLTVQRNVIIRIVIFY